MAWVLRGRIPAAGPGEQGRGRRDVWLGWEVIAEPECPNALRLRGWGGDQRRRLGRARGGRRGRRGGRKNDSRQRRGPALGSRKNAMAHRLGEDRARRRKWLPSGRFTAERAKVGGTENAHMVRRLNETRARRPPDHRATGLFLSAALGGRGAALTFVAGHPAFWAFPGDSGRFSSEQGLAQSLASWRRG